MFSILGDPFFKVFLNGEEIYKSKVIKKVKKKLKNKKIKNK